MMSRRSILSLFSALMCVLYMFAVVGFDIHIDHHCDHIYVVSLLNSIDCESIHPDDDCLCCEHHHGESGCDGEDCDNIIEALDCAGTPVHSVLCVQPAVIPSFIGVASLVQNPVFASQSCASAPTPSPGGLLSLICVIRA